MTYTPEDLRIIFLCFVGLHILLFILLIYTGYRLNRVEEYIENGI